MGNVADLWKRTSANSGGRRAVVLQTRGRPFESGCSHNPNTTRGYIPKIIYVRR